MSDERFKEGTTAGDVGLGGQMGGNETALSVVDLMFLNRGYALALEEVDGAAYERAEIIEDRAGTFMLWSASWRGDSSLTRLLLEKFWGNETVAYEAERDGGTNV